MLFAVQLAIAMASNFGSSYIVKFEPPTQWVSRWAENVPAGTMARNAM